MAHLEEILNKNRTRKADKIICAGPEKTAKVQVQKLSAGIMPARIKNSANRHHPSKKPSFNFFPA